MWYFFALSLPAVLLLTVGLLRYYKGTDVPLHVQLSVALGWLFSLSIVILVPIDVVTVRIAVLPTCAAACCALTSPRSVSLCNVCRH